MKIVILSIWFSENMGYAENCLPKSLAKMGHEVHVITSVCQVYYNQPYYESVYREYLGEGVQKPMIKQLDGYTLHRLPFGTILDKIYLKGLKHVLKDMRPDVVQTFDTFSFLTLQAARLKPILGYNLFTANHVVASIFPLLQNKKNNPFYIAFNFFTRMIPGRLISLITSRCYPATPDALEIAVRFFGVPRHKVQLSCLGVDTDMFKPISRDTDEVSQINAKRKLLGFENESIVCIYTGRFTEGKNPYILAQAIDKLRSTGFDFRGLFIGEGPQGDSISKMDGCVVLQFKPYHELPEYYTFSDIGVWPQQESTSMLDATACGLPIIVSDRVLATERIEGNGRTYEETNVDSLISVMKGLTDKDIRKRLGEAGTKKIVENFSWDRIARDRANDYTIFLNKK